MSAGDVFEIIWVVALCALLVGGLGVGAAWLTRRWSLRWHVLLVALVAALSTYPGILVIAHLMLLSSHDLLVMTVVSTVAASVAVLAALAVGSVVALWTRRLGERVRSFGPGVVPVVPDEDPAELRALYTALADAQRRLEQARLRELRLEESRRELVSWVSHDLRTPLAGLRAMAEALEDGIASDPARFHAQIRLEVDRMATMVDDLFELSRIHAGVLKLAPETLGLADLVSEAIAGADPVARARRVRLGGHVDSAIEVTADPAGLSRVLSNLLMNAIRHTPADGAVEVVGRALPDAIELSVSDGCGGLTADDIGRVFDLGWQGSPARPQEDPAQGAGLGLAIVKGIVEAHRGQVSVENLASAPGCRFVVLLPA